MRKTSMKNMERKDHQLLGSGLGRHSQIKIRKWPVNLFVEVIRSLLLTTRRAATGIAVCLLWSIWLVVGVVGVVALGLGLRISLVGFGLQDVDSLPTLSRRSLVIVVALRILYLAFVAAVGLQKTGGSVESRVITPHAGGPIEYPGVRAVDAPNDSYFWIPMESNAIPGHDPGDL